MHLSFSAEIPQIDEAEQDVATNRLPVARRKRHDNSTINLEIGARSQAACGSTLTFDKYMHPILQRLLFGIVILFLAAQALTIGTLFYTDHPILIPKWRAIAGLLALLAVTAVVFHKNDKGIIGAGLVSGFFLALISLFFMGSHPMHQYAAVRHVTADGFIESDEVYHRSAPVVKMLESEGSRVSQSGGRFGIERYLYSPRIGILLGKSLGEGKGSPDIGYEFYGISAWLFGVRVACEQFAFFAINLAPLLIAYGLYCQWKKKPPKDSLALEPVRALFLTGPFVVGLIPLIGT